MKKYPLLICGILVLAVIVRIICFVGLIGSDDLNYNRTAYSIAQGTFSPQLDHQRTRFGLFLPVAWTFKLFGISEISSTLFPFLCFVVTFMVLVWMATTYFGRWIGVMAGLLYALLPVEIFNTSILLPDLPAAAFIAVSGALFYWTERDSGHTTIRKADIKICGTLFLAGLMLGIAYMIRETSIFLGVFIAGYMLYKTWKRKAVQWSWIWFWIGFLIVIGAELGYYYWTTGNPFYRYHTVAAEHNLSVLAIRDRVHGLALLRRLTIEQFLVLFQVRDFSFYYFFILAGVIYGIQKRVKHLGYLIGWLLTFFLFFNFSSTSLTEYYPIRPISRYFIVLSVPGLIIMAWYLKAMVTFLTTAQKDMRAFQLSLLIPFGIMFGLNLFWFSAPTGLFLVAMIPVVLMAFFEPFRVWVRLRFSPKYAAIVPPLLLLYLNLLPGIYSVAKGDRPLTGITCERNIRPMLEFPLTHTIYTDSRTEIILEYYYAYQYDNQIKQFTEADATTWKHAYIIINWGRLAFLNRLYQTPIPDFVFHPFPQWKLYATMGDEKNPCLIYEVP
jgi:4-amino-4-deoxy-L-arabinose transferase-like glycosyltransferase